MKKIISLLIIAVMLLSPISTMAAGGVELPMIPIVTEFSISTGDAECSPGGAFDITVTVDKNPGVKKAVLEVICPKGITFSKAVQGEALSGLAMTVDNTAATVTFEGNNAVSGTGEAVTLTFLLDSSATNSVYSLTVRATDLVSASNGYISGASSISKVTLIDAFVGDINNDGIIDLKDVTTLRRYLAGGYGVSIQESASDVNSDGIIDLKDVTTLRRYLAGGYGIELQSVADYVVQGTENCGISTNKADEIVVARADSNSKPVTVNLSSLRLDSYVGKTDDLMNCYLNATMMGGNFTGATVISSIRDVISVTYDSTETFINIDGTRYTADAHPVFCNADGSLCEDIAVFGKNGKLTAEFKGLAAKSFKGRIIDYENDGKDDVFMLVPKTAYVVNGFYDKANGAYDEPYDKGNVTYVNCTALDFSSTLSVPVSYLTTSLEKGDIFVGALFNTTLFAEKATIAETYATGFGINGKVNLKNVGAVRYENVTVSGAKKVSVTENDFGSDNIRRYYIYKNEIISISGQDSAYSFSVLCDVEKKGNSYIANVLVPKNGTLVQEALQLHPSVGAELYSRYKLTYSGNKPIYNYTIISGYILTGEGYMLMINEKPDDSFITIPKGATLSYSSMEEKCCYSITYNNTTTDNVYMDEGSSIFYKYTITSGESAGFVNVRMYTKDTITESSFTAKTIDTSYLVKVNGVHVLVATMIDGKIE